MIVFKTFLKIVNKYKGTIILYTVMLVIFGGINVSSNDQTSIFTSDKPDIAIVNNDEYKGITKNLIDYMGKNSNIVEIKDNEESRNDALFYRDVNYIIYIPENYRNDVLNGINPEINIKSTKDYNASLAEMILMRYINVQNVYSKVTIEENELIDNINNNLKENSTIQIASQIDTNTTNKITSYFNFASYSIMAVVIYIICLVLSSFLCGAVNKRIIVSGMNYKKHNLLILYSSLLYAIIVWILYVILGQVLIGNIIGNLRGTIYIINSLIFTFCSLTIALLISTLVRNKNAISGIVNVIALGSAFLCGAFVPSEFLPIKVVNISKILPTYWYIKTNDILKNMEIINFNNLKPLFINMLIIIGFSILFIILNNFASRQRQKIN